MNNIDEIFINLDNKIECHNKGQLCEFSELVISAPNSKVINQHIKIESSFIKAISNIQNDNSQQKNEDSKDSEIEAKAIVPMLMINGEDVTVLLDEFKKIMLCKDMAYLYKNSEKVELTNFIYDKLTINDIKLAFGEYIKNFILNSL